MKKEKTHIVMHRYMGCTESGSCAYEIMFNKSLENTVRMQAMCDGLDRFDRRRPLWRFIHHIIAYPLTLTGMKFAHKLCRYSQNRM